MPKKDPGSSTDSDADSSKDSDSAWESGLFAPTVLNNQHLNNKHVSQCIFLLFFQIRQAPGTNSGLMLLLQQIEQALLHHQFGTRTFSEVPEDKRHYYDMNPEVEQPMLSLFSLASNIGFMEIIFWDHQNKTLSHKGPRLGDSKPSSNSNFHAPTLSLHGKDQQVLRTSSYYHAGVFLPDRCLRRYGG